MPFYIVIWIFILGGVGTLFRYGIQNIALYNESLLYFIIFLINIFGSFLIGAMYQKIRHPVWKTAWTTGFCGAFTTMSTFIAASAYFIENRGWEIGIPYIFMSILCGCLSYWVGQSIFMK